MELVVLAIYEDCLVINKQHRFHIKQTNLPKDFLVPRTGTYWLAKVVSFEEDTRSLHLEVSNTSASKSDYVQSSPVSLKPSRRVVLRGALPQEEASPQEERPPNPSSDPRPTHAANCAPFTLPGEGQSINIRAYLSKLTFSNGSLCCPVSHDGEIVALELCLYPYSHHPWFVLRDRLGKDVLEVTISRKNGRLQAHSDDLGEIGFNQGKKDQSGAVEPGAVSSAARGESTTFLGTRFPLPEATGREVMETVKQNIPFSELSYAAGFVFFRFQYRGTGPDLTAKIHNSVIVPEYKLIERYFSKVIGKKKIAVEIVLNCQQTTYGKVLSAEVVSAMSADIDRIDATVVSEAEKSYCVDHLFSAEDPLVSLEDLLSPVIKTPESRSATKIIELITERRPNTTHALQLSYLAGLHQSQLLPVKVGKERGTKTFLFLVQGKDALFFVLEACNAKLATYIWVCPQISDELSSRPKEVESIIKSFEEKKRLAYRSARDEGFAFIEHQYQDEKADFVDWLQKFNATLEA